MALISIVKVSDMGVMASFAVFSASSSAPAMMATGNQNHMRTRTAGATAAPMAKPYLEQTDCVTSRSTMLIDMRPNVNPDIIPANTTSRRLTAMYIKNSGSQHCNCFFSASAMD
nr:hypothetical protein Iba_chr11aCG5560 [Ipomoea batatas]